MKTIFSTHETFAALLENGTVVAWGDSNCKIPDEIQEQLKKVKVLFSNEIAFSALLDNGTVFAWGVEEYGGKIPVEIQRQLVKTVKMIFPQEQRFTALCNNGAIITWGENLAY